MNTTVSQHKVFGTFAGVPDLDSFGPNPNISLKKY